jgi:polyisoprenoid-binding protein YceI
MSITHDIQQISDTRWRLDASASTAEFRVPYIWGLASVTGRFERIEGWLEVDEDEQWHMVLVIDADSVDTANARRDKHLRSPAFFNVEKHPVVRFRSTDVNDRGSHLVVDGELEAAGETVPLQLEVTLTQTDDGLDLETSAAIDQRDVGLRFSPLRVIGTPTAVRVHARLRRE